MLQHWKFKRELKRLARHTVDFPIDAMSFVFGSLYYDLFLSSKRRVLSGQQGDSPRRAIYLIFPVQGLLPTHIRTLKYLLSKGLSVTVVSNIPLSTTDEEKLLTMCHCYIERPNFGYDFGGYRDGILSLKKTLCQTKQLILINDSVWFPVSSQTDWLEDVNSLNVDFSGAVSNYGMPRVEAENFRDLDFDYQTDHKNFHYCSFALSFGENILHHPGFMRFWKRFPLTSKKKRTVRRGEIGLTAWVLKHGFTHGETLGVPHLKQYLNALPDHQLAEIASKVIIPEDPRLKAVKKALLPQIDTLSRKELTGFILTAATRQGVGYALAYFSVFELGYPFLKKSPLWLDKEASDISLWLLEKMGTPESQDALKEAKILRQRI